MNQLGILCNSESSLECLNIKKFQLNYNFKGKKYQILYHSKKP